MRGLGWLLVLMAVTGITLRISGRRTLVLAATAAVVLLAHAVVEGWRWQLAFAYVGVIALVVRAAAGMPQRSRWRTAGWVTMVGLIGVSGLLAWQLPIVALPEPGGPHAVGTLRYSLLDEGRRDPVTGAEGRELVAEAWYPAVPSGATAPARFWQELYRGPADWISFFAAYLARMPSHGFPDAPAAGRYPMVIYNHGLASFTGDNTLLMEHLASHGYVVVSVAHPGYALRVALPEGGVRVIDFERAFADAPAVDGAAFVTELEAAATAEAAAEISLAFVEANPVFNRIAETWVEDIAAVLDDLPYQPALAALVDPDRIGVMGYSFGGAAAAEFCKADQRCRAGINIDGTQYGTRLRQPLEVPFLQITSADGAGQNRFLDLTARAPFHRYAVPGARHADFSDFAAVGRILKTLGLSGTIPGERMQAISRAAVRGFLDRYLKDRKGSLLDPAAHPEVEF